MCKIADCKNEKHHCKGFCKFHYNQFYKGILDIDGNQIRDFKLRVMGERKCKYPGCTNTNKKGSDSLRQGLCQKHRKWADRGIINRDTCEVIDEEKFKKLQKRIEITGAYIHCKMPGCLRKHKAKGFCSSHYRSYLHGHRDKDGNILYDRKKYKYAISYGDRCLVFGCNRGRHKLIKNFCKHHYAQFRKGILNQDGKKIGELKKEGILRFQYRGVTYTFKSFAQRFNLKLNSVKYYYYQKQIGFEAIKRRAKKCSTVNKETLLITQGVGQQLSQEQVVERPTH